MPSRVPTSKSLGFEVDPPMALCAADNVPPGCRSEFEDLAITVGAVGSEVLSSWASIIQNHALLAAVIFGNMMQLSK